MPGAQIIHFISSFRGILPQRLRDTRIHEVLSCSDALPPSTAIKIYMERKICKEALRAQTCKYRRGREAGLFLLYVHNVTIYSSEHKGYFFFKDAFSTISGCYPNLSHLAHFQICLYHANKHFFQKNENAPFEVLFVNT